MSSDEEEPTSPVLPKDSDHGSSVSSDLQLEPLKTQIWHQNMENIMHMFMYLIFPVYKLV
uniref:Uncharacterized protein n=1 Tax=Sphaeramia orbicularis TaxID=375764 RepID=A0A673C131_9TELE